MSLLFLLVLIAASHASAFNVTYNKVKVRACTNKIGSCTENCTVYTLDVDQCHYVDHLELSVAFRCKARWGAHTIRFLGPNCLSNYTSFVQQRYCDDCSWWVDQTAVRCTDEALLAYTCAGCLNASSGVDCSLTYNWTLGRCTTYRSHHYPNTMISVAMPRRYTAVPQLEYGMVYGHCSNATDMDWQSDVNGGCSMGIIDTFFQVSCEEEAETDAKLSKFPPELMPRLVQALKRRKHLERFD